MDTHQTSSVEIHFTSFELAEPISCIPGVLFDLDTVHLDGQPGQLPAPVPSTFSLLLRVQVVQPGPAKNAILMLAFLWQRIPALPKGS